MAHHVTISVPSTPAASSPLLPTDRPWPPQAPLSVSDVDREGCRLAWRQPRGGGGSPSATTCSVSHKHVSTTYYGSETVVSNLQLTFTSCLIKRCRIVGSELKVKIKCCRLLGSGTPMSFWLQDALEENSDDNHCKSFICAKQFQLNAMNKTFTFAYV